MGKRHIVDISKMRERITFQSQTPTSDNQGGVTLAWTDLITVWAKIEPISQRERIFTQELQYRRSHKIIVRSNASTASVTTAMQIVFGARTFQIKSIIDPDERGYYLSIDCEENVGS